MGECLPVHPLHGAAPETSSSHIFRYQVRMDRIFDMVGYPIFDMTGYPGFDIAGFPAFEMVGHSVFIMSGYPWDSAWLDIR